MDKKSQYKILEMIGIGSFGKVFAALDLQTKELVALKELGKKQLSTSDFLREVFCLTTLNHQNIVACRGLENHRNRRYLIMDYCEGGTLRNLLNSSKKLGLLACLDLIMQILAALEFAHQKNIIHRDIKPANILLKINPRRWDALLSDFGISAIASKFSANGLGLTGSPAYMAPEQFYGKFSIHSDLYSVGIILYELVVGERPFNSAPKDLLKAHLSEPIHFPDELPFLIRNIITIALKKSPEQRFENAQSMHRTIKLASEILRKENQVQPVLFSAVSSRCSEIKTVEKVLLTKPIDHLLELNKSIYLACDLSFQEQRQLNNQFQEIASRNLKICSESKIIDLQVTDSSYVMTQQLKNNHRLIYFKFGTHQSFTLKVPTTRLFWNLYNFEKQEHLFLAYYSTLDQKIHCQIFNTNNWQQIRTFPIAANLDSKDWNLQPFEIRNLNPQYGISYYRDCHNLKSTFQIFNHQGNWIANFLFKATIDKITVYDDCAKLMLATDLSDRKSVFLINLNLFQIDRIALPIAPEFIISRQQYFILADKQGQVLIYDVEEDILTQHKFELSSEYQIRAIACTQNLELIATTWSTTKNQGFILRSKFSNS